MADIKAGYEEIPAGHKGQPPLATAVVYPCSEGALKGALEAAKAGLIAPLLVGPPVKSTAPVQGVGGCRKRLGSKCGRGVFSYWSLPTIHPLRLIRSRRT